MDDHMDVLVVKRRGFGVGVKVVNYWGLRGKVEQGDKMCCGLDQAHTSLYMRVTHGA